MLKDYKAVALKNSEGSGEQSYTFMIKGNDSKEAHSNAKKHILNNYKANATYHIEVIFIGNSLT